MQEQQQRNYNRDAQQQPQGYSDMSEDDMKRDQSRMNIQKGNSPPNKTS